MTVAPTSCPVDPSAGHDVSAELSTWLQSLPPGSVADLGGLTYRCDRPLRITGGRGLTIQDGVLVRRDAESPSISSEHVSFRASRDCSLVNVTIEGVAYGSNIRPGARTQHGVTVRDSFGIRIEDCCLIGIAGSGIVVESRDTFINGVLIDSPGQCGVLVRSSRVFMSHSVVSNADRNAVMFDPRGGKISDVCIVDCSLSSFLTPLLVGSRGPVSKVRIRGGRTATVHSRFMETFPVSDGGCSHWVVSDHQVTGKFADSVYPVMLFDMRNFTMMRCRFTPTGASSGGIPGFVNLMSCGGEFVFIDNDFGSGVNVNVRYRSMSPKCDLQVHAPGATLDESAW